MKYVKTIEQSMLNEVRLFMSLKRRSMKKPEIAKTWGSTDFESDPIGS